MTRDEAIYMLYGIQADNLNLDDAYTKDKYDALTMAINALEQEPCNTDTCKVVKAYMNGWDNPNNSDLISRQAVLKMTYDMSEIDGEHFTEPCMIVDVEDIQNLPSVNPQEPKTGWNNHQIACMLADLFGDACACNYNGIDEWLPEVCDFKDTCCPNPVGVACWEQFLKHYQNHKGSYTE